jgi:hypothetical protein
MSCEVGYGAQKHYTRQMRTIAPARPLNKYTARPPVKPCPVDLRVGGSYHFVFVTGDGRDVVWRHLPGG